MKNKAITLLCASVFTLATTIPAIAGQKPNADVMAADAVVMRPALLGATVVGSALFVVALPFTAFSKSVKSSAKSLVVNPAKATFTRRLGDFNYYDTPARGTERLQANRQ